VLIAKTQPLLAPSATPRLRPGALLVEDEALVAMVAEDSLYEIGFEPIVVSNAAAAIRALEEGATPVLAVVDVGLPGERGDVLARRLRSLAPDLKIIIASGYDEGDLRDRFADDTFVAVLGKPYTQADLRRVAHGLGVDLAPT
jgi:CheY-like chemotaxis protein